MEDDRLSFEDDRLSLSRLSPVIHLRGLWRCSAYRKSDGSLVAVFIRWDGKTVGSEWVMFGSGRQAIRRAFQRARLYAANQAVLALLGPEKKGN